MSDDGADGVDADGTDTDLNVRDGADFKIDTSMFSTAFKTAFKEDSLGTFTLATAGTAAHNNTNENVRDGDYDTDADVQAQFQIDAKTGAVTLATIAGGAAADADWDYSDGTTDLNSSGGVDAAKEVCRNTKGPVASIFYQGLDRINEGVESAEKAVVAYGGVQMGQLEKNVSWISLFIALAPMLGFMGTVIGMITAFDKIEAAGDMQPSLVAGGIKVALLTTVFGLIVAIILQVFYNYIVAKIDSIVNDMEDASINLIDILVAYKK